MAACGTPASPASRLGAWPSGTTIRKTMQAKYVRARLRGSKTPERIVVWDELPRNDIGKIVRREAQARLAHERT